MTATVTIQRAGTYILNTLVDSIDVTGSPFSYLEIKPTTLHAPSCVAKDVPIEIMAGFQYSFLIQGRDRFSNNLITNLSTAVGSSKSAVMSLTTNVLDTYTATILDDSSLGVYRVEYDLPKTQTSGVYDYNVELLSKTVPTD